MVRLTAAGAMVATLVVATVATIVATVVATVVATAAMVVAMVVAMVRPRPPRLRLLRLPRLLRLLRHRVPSYKLMEPPLSWAAQSWTVLEGETLRRDGSRPVR